jgi:hypothetical protein
MWQHCTVCYKIADVVALYSLLQNPDNLSKSPYTLNVCIQLAIIGVVYHGVFIAVIKYAHLSSFKFGLCPLTQDRQEDPVAIVTSLLITVCYTYNNLHFLVGQDSSVGIVTCRAGRR